MAVHFLYLILASISQVCWLYNVKRVNGENWKHIKTVALFKFSFWKNFFPIIIYIFLSIVTIILLTHAMEKIAASTTYAIWTGLVIVITSIIDQVILKQKVDFLKYLFICMIVIGIVGLRMASKE